MSIQRQVLQAAVALCRSRGGWRFKVDEIVRALPHLHPGTVRTHVGSRCCVNAPKNHEHRLDYFERVGRGEYEVRSKYRRARPAAHAVAERAPRYAANKRKEPLRETIHAVVHRSASWFVAECLELAAVVQGRSLDELASSLQEAIELHFAGEDAAALGFVDSPRLSITYELPARAG